MVFKGKGGQYPELEIKMYLENIEDYGGSRSFQVHKQMKKRMLGSIVSAGRWQGFY